MFGFQAFARGIAKVASHTSFAKMSYAKPIALSWSLKSLPINIDKHQQC